jgi:hypothetical protein
MSGVRGAYFPGLVTAPLLLVVGVTLIRRLVATADVR